MPQDDTGTGDEWQDANLMYTSDPAVCLLCGAQVIAFPEGIHHADESRDADHVPLPARGGGR